MDITAEVRSIQKLADYFFVVPDYQREYVWQADANVSRFLEDINDEFEPALSKQSNYFIGSTIIVKRPDGMYDVVDGQQRLTTIVITLCAIRDKLKDLAIADEEILLQKEELLKVVKELLYKYELASKKHITRLVLQYPESKDYLLNLIVEKPFTDAPTPSIKRMKAAYNTAFEFLKELETSEAALLINFISYFLTNVEMVIIRPDNLGSALKIFETINERGVGLNAMDLLKNLLFSNAKNDDFEVIKQTWKEMMTHVQESGEGDKPLRFLRYFLMARYHNGVIREDQIYKWIISDEGKAAIRYETYPVRFAKELKAAAAMYRTFIQATMSTDADATYPAITGIGYLSKKTSRQHLVLLLAFKENTDATIINTLARNIEGLVFYYAINRTLTKSYEIKFANWASELRNISTIDQLQTFLRSDFSVELESQRAKFSSSFSTKSQQDLQPQYRVKYVLGKLDHFIRTKVNYPILSLKTYQSYQLEHILPQTPLNEPVEQYPQPYDYSNTKFRIGNLTLLEAPLNQVLNFTNDLSSNEWFEKKRETYKKSDVLLTSTLSAIQIGTNTAFNTFSRNYLKHFELWNMQTVAERQEMMRNLIGEIWKLEV